MKSCAGNVKVNSLSYWERSAYMFPAFASKSCLGLAHAEEDEAPVAELNSTTRMWNGWRISFVKDQTNKVDKRRRLVQSLQGQCDHEQLLAARSSSSTRRHTARPAENASDSA